MLPGGMAGPAPGHAPSSRFVYALIAISDDVAELS
jgi:hypothetical protein